MKFSSFVSLLAFAGVALSSPTKRAFGPPNQLNTAARPRYFGAAIGEGHLDNQTDRLFKQTAAEQFSGCTPENELKWEVVEPFQNQFNFTAADIIFDFAKQHNFVFRGHTLVWHNQLAPFVSTLNGTELLAAMENHITKVMGHYRGKLYAWDVVNEAFNDDGTLGASPFLTQLGPSYIQTAFEIARRADPHAKLYINDFNTEGINNKSDALLALVKDLRAKNLIDGVGFQSHFIIGELPTDIQQNLQRFVDAGVEVAITELDIRTNLPVTAAAAAQQPKDYATVINACKAVSRCVGVTTWGITDMYSWVLTTFPGQGDPLLFDNQYNKKPAFFSVIDAFNS